LPPGPRLEQLPNHPPDDFGALRDDGVAERANTRASSTSSQSAGKPINQRQNAGFRCPPSVPGKSLPPFVRFGPGPFSSRRVMVGSRPRFASVSRLGRVGPGLSPPALSRWQTVSVGSSAVTSPSPLVGDKPFRLWFPCTVSVGRTAGRLGPPCRPAASCFRSLPVAFSVGSMRNNEYPATSVRSADIACRQRDR